MRFIKVSLIAAIAVGVASAVLGQARDYQPNWKWIEADNGQKFAIDTNSFRPWDNGRVEAVIYVYEGTFNPTNMKRVLFDCRGHMTDISGGHPDVVYLAPRSIGVKLSEIACAEVVPPSPERKARFALLGSEHPFPTISGSTDLPDGTYLFVTIKKPWLPDGEQRAARGLPACDRDCVPAIGPDGLLGEKVQVSKGKFLAGPLSFNRQPFQRGQYTVEISLSFADINTATLEQIAALKNGPIYSASVLLGLR